MTTDTDISVKIQITSLMRAAKDLNANLRRRAQTIWSHLYWRKKLNQQPNQPLIKSAEDLVNIIVACVWAFVVVIVMIVFGGFVGTMLYSVTFVQQPMKTMAPIDMAYTKMLNDIALLLVGSITTLVGMYAVKKGAEKLAEKVMPVPSAPTPTVAAAPVVTSPAPSAMPDWNFMGYVNPPLDEEWRPGPPPTTPADYLHPEREEIAHERAAAKVEA